MRQIELINLLSQACGRDLLEGARFPGGGKEELLEVAPATVHMRGIAEALERFESTEKYGRRIWPGIWLRIQRESIEELRQTHED